MDYSTFYKDIDTKKQIKNLIKKYGKIVVYGAGVMSNILFSEYAQELKKLNIVAVCDRKYTNCKNETYFGYPAIGLNDINNYDFDAVLINLRLWEKVSLDIQRFLLDSNKENIKVARMFKIPFMYCVKQILSYK